MSCKFHIVVLATLLFSACTTVTTEDGQPKTVSKLQPVQQFALPTAHAYVEDMEANSRRESEPNIELKVVAAPDISARNHPRIDLSEKGYDPAKEPIKVQLLNFWDDTRTYYANLNYKNTGPQVTKNIYIFGYDRLGRLVSTTVRNTFFRKQQNLVRTERFAKGGQAVRWTILVKN